jgi:hypothetical protein
MKLMQVEFVANRDKKNNFVGSVDYNGDTVVDCEGNDEDTLFSVDDMNYKTPERVLYFLVILSDTKHQKKINFWS